MNDDNAGISEFGFYRLSDLFVEVRSFTPPSELHGLLCGQLCAGLRPAQQSWLVAAQEQMNVPEGLETRAKSSLADFYDHVLASLSADNLSFSVLLPGDEEPVVHRTEALGQWCTGFISGYGMAGIDKTKMSEEAAGVLTDLAQVAMVEAEDLEETEETERDFFEVYEYVRMAALMLFNEHRDRTDQAQGQKAENRPVH